MKLAFVHFAKAGGTYVGNCLDRHLLEPQGYVNHRNPGRDYTEAQLLTIIKNANDKTFLHNHHFNWSPKAVEQANENGFLTFMFLRDPKDLLCSLYFWSKDLVEDGLIYHNLFPQDLIDLKPKDQVQSPFKERQGYFDCVFNRHSLDLSLDEFVRTYIDESNIGCKKFWHLPEPTDQIQYVAKLNEQNLKDFFNDYLNLEYTPIDRQLNVSSNKGYEHYKQTREISEDTDRLINNHPEYIKYKTYLNK